MASMNQRTKMAVDQSCNRFQILVGHPRKLVLAKACVTGHGTCCSSIRRRKNGHDPQLASQLGGNWSQTVLQGDANIIWLKAEFPHQFYPYHYY
jgi:hypothetical protein